MSAANEILRIAMPTQVAPAAGEVDASAMFKLSYGLFVLTAQEGDKDNGCIINTAVQVTTDPQRITIAVNKKNFTHDMILRTGQFNVSILTEQTDFSVFQHFGFQSGQSTNKFVDYPGAVRSENGLYYLSDWANAVLSGKVFAQTDFGTHTVFAADVTEAKVLSNIPSVTYAYYFANIKPKPAAEKKKGYICRICGYVYEGEPLPPDFICPICKHGAADFEPL